MPEFMDQDRIYLDLDNDRIEWMLPSTRLVLKDLKSASMKKVSV